MQQPQPGAQHTRSLTIIGAALFGGGLLLVATGILLIFLGIAQGPWFLTLGGVIAILIGLASTLYGMIQLYRSIIRADPRLAVTIDTSGKEPS